MVLLTREQILEPRPLPFEDVEVPEWGGTVRVQGMNSTERDAFDAAQSALRRENRLRNIRARLVACSCVDEQGKRLFSEEDARALGAQSVLALDRVVEVAMRLSSMKSDAVEEAEKNSEPGRNGSSGSNSDTASASPSESSSSG